MTQFIEDSCLEEWMVIGSGAFGQIYKARHRRWGCDVAIKLLHCDDGNNESLLREIDLMRQGSSPYVVHVRGVFRGRPRSSGPSVHLGLVMEVMERGSLASLQEALGAAPPWPLVFRLALQVARGINFLHSLPRPVLHLDLKPQNVLLDDYLNAKLTDFGLARISQSISRLSGKDGEKGGGTVSYMPPEAFGMSKYRPTPASDIYSYGILLWSIVTGKQPYEYAVTGLVEIVIPKGQRPSLDDIRGQAEGLAQLTGLMERCWDSEPKQRPPALECTTETEQLYKIHKHTVNDAVYEVLKKLDQREAERMREQLQTASVMEHFEEVTVSDKVPTGSPPVQETAGGWPANQRDRRRAKDPPSPRPASVRDVDTSRPPPSPSAERSPEGTTEQTAQHVQKNIESLSETTGSFSRFSRQEADGVRGRVEDEMDGLSTCRQVADGAVGEGRVLFTQGEKMATRAEVLLGTLEDLRDEDFKKFKWFLQQRGGVEGFPAIPKSRLETAERVDTVTEMVQTYSTNSTEVTRIVLMKMNQNNLAKKLSNTI